MFVWYAYCNRIRVIFAQYSCRIRVAFVLYSGVFVSYSNRARVFLSPDVVFEKSSATARQGSEVLEGQSDTNAKRIWYALTQTQHEHGGIRYKSNQTHLFTKGTAHKLAT